MRHGFQMIAMPVIFMAIVFISCQKNGQQAEDQDRALTLKQELGKKLFFDKNLSTPPGQACADCHAPQSGFSNPDATLPVSRGVHPDRFGNRNDLTAAYAGFSPEFHYDPAESVYVGGMFWDGRAATLEEQAKGPFLNTLEMANPDAKTVVEKIRNAEYTDQFKKVFGAESLDDPEKAYAAIAEAIADYERSHELNKFNSKYDYYLDGKASLTEQEMRGLALFEDTQKGNCAACHTSRMGADGSHPIFTMTTSAYRATVKIRFIIFRKS